MGSYDKTKDVMIQELGKMKADPGTAFLRARIYSYNGGDHKLSIERIRIKQDGTETFMRPGRLSMKESRFMLRMQARWIGLDKAQKLLDKEEGKKIKPKAKKKVKEITDEKPKPKAAKPKRKKKTKKAGVGGW